MTLIIHIDQMTIDEEEIKRACVEIDGVCKGEAYSYPAATSDATIESEVQADLTALGYTWS